MSTSSRRIKGIRRATGPRYRIRLRQPSNRGRLGARSGLLRRAGRRGPDPPARGLPAGRCRARASGHRPLRRRQAHRGALFRPLAHRRRHRRAVSRSPSAVGRRYVHVRRCDAGADRLCRRRQRQGLDENIGRRAAARFRLSGPRARKRHYQAGDAQVPRQHADAAQPGARHAGAEQEPGRDREDAAKRFPLRRSASGPCCL